MKLALITLFSCLFGFSLASADTKPLKTDDISSKTHAIALHGSPKYPHNFKHFDYVNPNAPKGGEIHLPSVSDGGFDSLNGFIIKGNPASGLSYMYDTLMVSSDDEAFTQYGLIAKSVELAKDRSWIIFHLNPQATFHDGKPITADDVVFTFNLLVKEGHPRYRVYYADVESVKTIDKHQVKFNFKQAENRELPLIVGQIPVLPKHYWESHDFNKTSLEPPIGSGPYRIGNIQNGRSISYERIDDYWAKDLPVNKGRYNFDTIVFEYFRDNTIALEAFKAGEYDLRAENTSRNWSTAYKGDLFDKHIIIKEEIQHQNPTGMQGFAFNIRRWPFQDSQVREALAYAYDFEWTNQKLQYGAYTRTTSFFSNSELASTDLPSEEELNILKPFKEKLPAEVFTKTYQPPQTNGSGNNRQNLMEALKILNAAGWEIKNKKLVEKTTNKAMQFEILVYSPDFIRIIQPFKKNLEKLGIDVSIRRIDIQQYIERMNTFDFDMAIGSFGQSLSPGNEQQDYWGSAAATTEGSNNMIGIKDPIIDALIENVIAASDRESLIHATRALDRVLLWNHYIIPQYHIRSYRIAYWDKFSRPSIAPKYHNFGLDNWWIDKEKTAKIQVFREQK